jgi:hypothetical protein
LRSTSMGVRCLSEAIAPVNGGIIVTGTLSSPQPSPGRERELLPVTRERFPPIADR